MSDATSTFDALDTGLPQLIGDLLEIPVDWAKRPRQMHVSPARAQLDVLAETITGDETTYTEITITPEVGDPYVALEPTVHLKGELTLQVSVWSPVQGLGKSARRYLTQLMLRLRWPSTHVALVAMGLALVTIEPIQLIDPPEHDRSVSRAAMDLRFAFGLDESDELIPHIETVEIRSEYLRDETGAQLPKQIAITVPETP